MSELTVRALTEDDWEAYRAVRLEALRESPEAFVGTFEEESTYDEGVWRERMKRSTRLVAEQDGRAVGVVSVGRAKTTDEGEAGEIFGLWVHPERRGSGVATALVHRGAAEAQDAGQTHVVYWVGTENGRAVAFASGIGFRPTDFRRPMRVASEEDGKEEAAMVLALGEDKGSYPRL
ncbi:GCN5 family acetyltransferase [Intrasporangium chromatireducens Q5-1]|uniref:GCN5 family acetyltransferase n=1 Tax=Intrasporangium chromatireducens Q5-1 TaxID=584657 RepID=W9GI65_9MICO|nr:GNAT family N-acetyltransferase [Intrasporangium chromatireducens]EWT05790.1 GCN5 family acetyltransferase [Intrasporangium chromatireducens Q5-1]